jgi:hypothetical protein
MKSQGSNVKQIPATFYYRTKLATAVLAFVLMILLSTGNVSEVQIALPVHNDAVPVHTQIPEEEIDYEEFMNRLPLRKPESKPGWMNWLSESRRRMTFS